MVTLEMIEEQNAYRFAQRMNVFLTEHKLTRDLIIDLNVGVKGCGDHSMYYAIIVYDMLFTQEECDEMIKDAVDNGIKRYDNFTNEKRREKEYERRHHEERPLGYVLR